MIYHRHSNGNHPHVHRGHDKHHSHAHGHHHQPHEDPSRHGHHAYDVNGRQPALINPDAGEVGHWHFDGPFKGIALAPIFVRSIELAHPRIEFVSSHLSYPPQVPRPPPTLS